MESRYVSMVEHRSLEFRRAEPGPSDVDEVGGLVAGLLTGATRVLTGASMGPVHVTVRATRTPPEDLAEGWEDIVELSLLSIDGPVLVVGPYDDDSDPAARLDLDGPGSYRVRVHARGRDLDFDAVAREPREHYLVQSWPADPRPPTTLAAQSRTAASSSTTRQVRDPAARAVTVRSAAIDAERQEALERSIKARARTEPDSRRM